MNSQPFQSFHRERKARCFAATIRSTKPHARPDSFARALSGWDDADWERLTTIANETHDCGKQHDVPSAEGRKALVDLFTSEAVQADRIAAREPDEITAEVRKRAERAGRRLEVLK